MAKRLILLVGLILGVMPLMAQDSAQPSINDIKRQGEVYLYAEATAATWDEALENALLMLGVEVDAWLENQTAVPAEGYKDEMHRHTAHLQASRGELVRAFVYVPKAVILPPTPIQMLAERPKEQPVETKPVYQPTAFERQMMEVTDAGGIGAFIKRLEAEGKIVRYGKYKDMPAEIDCYLFVYNREMKIPAYLHKQGNEYTNITNGEKDHVTHYTGCGAWWFQLR